MPIPLRADFDAPQLHKIARKTKDGPQAWRLSTLASIYDRASRTEAAKIGGATVQIVRDWVVKFNGNGAVLINENWYYITVPVDDPRWRNEMKKVLQHSFGIFVLIGGTLFRDPAQRMSRVGKQFVTAFIRSGTAADALWCNVIAFDQAAQSKLLRSKAGDDAMIQGAANFSVFEKNGKHRASIDVTAAHILALGQPRPAKPRRDERLPLKLREAPSSRA
jgi:Single-strand binding protein family